MLSTKSTKDFFKALDEMTHAKFFSWLKTRSEDEWGDSNQWNNGFTDSEIISFEEKWQFTFPEQYRIFLSQLGAPMSYSPMCRWIEEKNDMGLVDLPTFFDWKKDEKYIKNAIENVIEGLIFDIENNNLWRASWGEKPDSLDKQIAIFKDVFAKAPKLIPIQGNRYLLTVEIDGTYPILSVHQSDIIIYGYDFRKYLVLDMSKELNLNHDNAYVNAVEKFTREMWEKIPFWGELIS